MSGPDATAASHVLERVLVLVKGEHEGHLTLDLLSGDGLSGVLCGSMRELCAAMKEGVGAVLLAEELLTAEASRELQDVLSRQPPWSDCPIVVFSAPNAAPRPAPSSASYRGNVTFLDRPVRVRTMLAALHAAIASRRRQYEARRAIESRDAFLAMLAHELRNPLAAISFATASLDRQVEGKDRPRAHAVIDRQTRHLTRLVDDLLDVARITTGKVVLARETLRLAEVVQTAFETLESRAREQGLSYELDVSGESPAVVGDRQRLEQVFANLLTNAIKYTPRGGMVRVEVGVDESGDLVTVSVVDTGVGLASEMHERVFEPFAQVDTSRDRAQGGLGLGLALVRSIVDLHGGTVVAESEGIGRGSRFRVRLPRVHAETTSEGAFGSAPPDDSPKTVVVVEDNTDVRELLVELLEGFGHRVLSAATDGPSGLELVLSLSPDIAFVDVGLPGFDGLELARQARAAGSATHLVALTGYGQARDKLESKTAGFDDHLVKPVVYADLEGAIRRVSLALRER